jgi:4'-phosphopantetheinyl transferase
MPPAIAVWTVALDGGPHDAELDALPADERWRAAAIVVPAVRRRFVRARAALRRILAGETGRAPHALAIDYGAHGKPRLPDHPGLHFNLSHSGEFAVIATSTLGEVGIDLEALRPRSDLLPVARRFFAAHEADAVAACEGEARSRAFLRLWTRKEAVLKASGRGIGVDTRSIAVGVGACAPRVVVDFDPRPLLLRDVELAPGSLAAACVAPHDHALAAFDVRHAGHLAPGRADRAA